MNCTSLPEAAREGGVPIDEMGRALGEVVAAAIALAAWLRLRRRQR